MFFVISCTCWCPIDGGKKSTVLLGSDLTVLYDVILILGFSIVEPNLSRISFRAVGSIAAKAYIAFVELELWFLFKAAFFVVVAVVGGFTYATDTDQQIALEAFARCSR